MRNLKIFITTAVAFVVIGCSGDNNDSKTVCPKVEPEINTCPVVICEEPKPCSSCPDCLDPVIVIGEQDIYGYITDIIDDRIDSDNIFMQQYVDGEPRYEGYAEIIDINGSSAAKNIITLPTFAGEPIKHRLVLEFTQVK